MVSVYAAEHRVIRVAIKVLKAELAYDPQLADRTFVEVLDFGIAKLRDDRVAEPVPTLAGAVLGTPLGRPPPCRHRLQAPSTARHTPPRTPASSPGSRSPPPRSRRPRQAALARSSANEHTAGRQQPTTTAPTQRRPLANVACGPWAAASEHGEHADGRWRARPGGCCESATCR
jgi:hypothetical protein